MTAMRGTLSTSDAAAYLRATKYDFPPKTWDFKAAMEIPHATTQEVESYIGSQLRSGHLDGVRDGLSNVLYWGYGRSKGRRAYRVDRFRRGATNEQIMAFTRLVENISGPGLKAIADLGLPQFSGVSFISKIRMFLNPESYVVLDLKLAQLRKIPGTILDCLTSVGTQIKVTRKNEDVYQRWSLWCRNASEVAFGTGASAVRAERAIFHLVDQGQLDNAAKIILAMSVKQGDDR